MPATARICACRLSLREDLLLHGQGHAMQESICRLWKAEKRYDQRYVPLGPTRTGQSMIKE
jgi:hypothetical protein